MITNFEEFIAIREASDWAFNVENLSMAEQLILRSIISCWGEEDLKPVKYVLRKYYNIEVPNQIIIEIFHNDLNLAIENFTDSICDTCQREILIDSVLKKVGSRAWPINSEGEEVFNQFITDLPKKLAAVGGKLEA